MLAAAVVATPVSDPYPDDLCGRHTGNASNRCLLESGHTGACDDDPPVNMPKTREERAVLAAAEAFIDHDDESARAALADAVWAMWAVRDGG